MIAHWRKLAADEPEAQWRVLFLAAAALTVLLTILGALTHPAIAVAALVAAFAVPLALRSVGFAFTAVVAIVTCLPFGAIPLGIGFNPTFLDIALLALYAIWAFKVATREPDVLRWPPLGAAVGLFIGLMLVSLLAGLAHGTPTKNQIRVFGEMVLGAGLFFIVANLITDRASLRRVYLALVGFGTLSAAIGLALYVLPDGLEADVLSLLRFVDYPSGPGVLRYINDDPTRLQRAVGTSIDPNSFGGMLAAMAALLAPQTLARSPLVPRRLAVAMLVILTAAVLATVSRGSLVGLAAGIGVVGLARDRRMLGAAALIAVLLVLLAGTLPWTEAYVANFVDGLRMQDRSTQMRLGEYRDAMRLIERYPLLGVGFGSVRDVDLYRGVSSLYLIVAETMGLVGLAALIALFGGAALRLVVAWRRMEPDGLRAVVLGGLAALTAAAVSGILDHYYFTYPHAFALLWLILGVAMGAIRLDDADGVSDTGPGSRRAT